LMMIKQSVNVKKVTKAHEQLLIVGKINLNK